MIKGIALLVPKAGISTAAFHRHWRETHGPLALRITTLRRYVQSHRKPLAVPGFDQVPLGGVAEVWFDDLATLQDLPDDAQGPRFVINATNLQSGRLWRFSKPYMADYLVGLVEHPTVKIADAVAASSAFPPFLSPFHLSVPLDAYKTVEGNKLTSPEYRKKVYLSDGGVYDNLGIETTWKNFQTILVSDAGGRMGGNAKPPGFWLTHTKHVLDVIDNQVRSLRRKQVVQSFKNGEREGAYWSTYADLAEYRAPGLLPCPFTSTQKLARVKTGLTKLDERTQEQLINWGYAACDAGVRSYVDRSLPPPVAFPYPNAGV